MVSVVLPNEANVRYYPDLGYTKFYSDLANSRY